MTKLKVNIFYGYYENHGHTHIVTFTKIFELANTPNVECRIKINSDIFQYVDFKHLVYIPEKDMYIINEDRADGTYRYNQRSANMTVIDKKVERCKNEGWEVSYVKK